ncbi:Cenp-O kinetochore centromere component-domain-containing protein [Lobosporangium transversale]|uniref:Cenp-O kinetochore centromere component-domain-containing protein n=1 Tax=Lobosporangium transversale TaxID=64571 RepID=A0A1Y2H0Q5_9FUNG|nr:Cenp-O kinetochore centromere component-domain-containing protein [Lobosporangium transversale]ORZ28137.1 Cenp-O kinetochore centromere component-domain-containing protein [Lobosporangium transversale]|eukprot:XP_021885822.1 Cenp-O kinetochore centromere component-domain-containing protein [Lobosporangium transversale]
MDSASSQITAALQEDVNILRQELLALEEKRASLLKQIDEEERSMVEEPTTLVPPTPTKTDKDEKRMQNILMAYRLTGVTLFSVNELDENDWSAYPMDGFPEAPKEVGIRFETFAQGKYHEPYYVILRKKTLKQSDDKDQRKDKDGAADGDNEQQKQMQKEGDMLYVYKHTIPHWIPLQEVEKRYLNRDVNTFTRIISEYLQEYVAQRESENAKAIVSPTLPGLSEL